MIIILNKVGNVRALIALTAAGALLVTACGGSTTEASESSDRPTIVVSTNIMGDVVGNIVGDAADVITVMPVGADPHDFQPSAQQIAQLNDADAVILNGGGFEEGLLDIVEAAEADGTVVFEAISAVETLEFAGHDEHSDDDEHDDDEDDEHSDGDPHFFSDPVRVATAADAISEFVIAEIDGIDADVVRAATASYLEELAALDSEITLTLDAVSPTDRVLVTNHEVLTYFADRYDFEIIGTVIPGGTTVDSADAQALAELASIIEAEGIPAVFADTSSSDELAQTLALEAGAIEVVQLYSESLGPEYSDGATYLEMMRTNAERIAEALSR
jgi:zinc/manganese transport system substrate-binding protein